ncbi:O-antigen ligase family protein [Microbacterium sp. ASV81]|uniref:O-antigen ligase family protein n=1 Tax=Microbacterium capsulatum TaxID=3041921 RepID=A0ABU0XJU8_9MICO|nr:O-antigen ligase family protein [Microbacterium sp. ASV81]MDQ4215398.1 O-antigen ligase family protein [Microbacterium sp. ASV81]
MAQHSRLSTAPPPSAPARESTRHLLLRAHIALLLFGVLAHTAVFNLFGIDGAAVVLGVLLLATLGLAIPRIAMARPARFPWRRMPWAALVYLALALVSVLWSRWPMATLLTWVLHASITVVALFIAFTLSWHEIVRALASALKWILGLSVLLEAWVALVLHHPLIPNFAIFPPGKVDPHWYWVRGDLIGTGRIQGIVGNSNTLGILCALALVVFALLYAEHTRRRSVLLVWILLAGYLLLRAGSATSYASLAGGVAVLVAALLMRRVGETRGRARLYVLFAAAAVVGAGGLWLLRDKIFGALGKSSDLTGRVEIWRRVIARAVQHPIFGNGFSSPWVPWDPAFHNWILDHRITVFMAHEMWLDAFLQLGAIGVLLIAIAFLAFAWRAWFFAVDRPRWDLDETRPYSALSLLPLAIVAMMLVLGLAESTPIILWGWLLLILFSFKMKISPFVGTGPGEGAPPEARRRAA